jgi:integrase
MLDRVSPRIVDSSQPAYATAAHNESQSLAPSRVRLLFTPCEAIGAHLRLARGGVSQLNDEKRSAVMIAKNENQTATNGEPPDVTFEQCARRYLQVICDRFAPETERRWTGLLEAYAYPVIGNVNLREVTSEQVHQILEPIWLSKLETSSRLRRRLEAIFDFARASGRLSGPNPARWKGGLAGTLPQQPRRQPARSLSLPPAEVPGFVYSLRQCGGVAASALELQILTAARTNEITGACWSEFDLHSGVWHISAKRQASGYTRAIPLSVAALDVLARQDSHDGFVFEGSRGRALSSATIASTIRAMNARDGARWTDATTGVHVVARGFRNTFREWVSEIAAYGPEVAETVLGKRDTRALTRAGSLNRQREVLDDWAEFCAGGLC